MTESSVMREFGIMLFVTGTATVITMLVYRLLTPRRLGLKAALSNRAKMLDAALLCGLCGFWGVLVYYFLKPFLNY